MSLEIKLTGANVNNKELHRSIGGKISNFPLKNGKVFSTLSKIDLQEGKSEIRVIALTNNSNTDIPSLSIYYEVEDISNQVDILIGAQYFDSDDTVELLDNDADIPFNVTFVDALGVDNPVEITDGLDAGQSISLWMKRTVPKKMDNCDIEVTEITNKVVFFINY